MKYKRLFNLAAAHRPDRARSLAQATEMLQRVLSQATTTQPSPLSGKVSKSLLMAGPKHTPRQPAKQQRRATRVLVPAGAKFISCDYRSKAGRLAYKLYVPSGYRGEALPLIVMLHGCTQSADDFAAGTRMNELAEEGGFFVAYPEQAAGANPSKCWNWFESKHQRRDVGEPALVAGVTHQIMREYAVDSQRVYVAGLSAGGAAAAVLGALYPDLYAAIGIHSGLPCGAASNMSSAFTAMQNGAAARSRHVAEAVPTIVFHGDRDTTVHPANGERIVANAMIAELRPGEYEGCIDGGHRYRRTWYADADGRVMLEAWVIHGAGHAWSGGGSAGSYTDPKGPDASREMVRFFLAHSRTAASDARSA